MKTIQWSDKKNHKLKKQRGVCFEEVLYHIDNEDILDIRKHPNQKKYPGQKIFVIDMNDYIYLVPFTEDDEKIFLKTIIPSRKAKKELKK